MYSLYYVIYECINVVWYCCQSILLGTSFDHVKVTFFKKFYKVQLQHFIGDMYKLLVGWHDVYSGVYIPKIIKMHSFWLSYSKIIKVSSLFWTMV